jgi:hypothetical protein
MNKTLFSFLFLGIVFISSAQKAHSDENSKKIIYKGIVYDENREPLPFVNVYMGKGKNGTTTDINGEFTLKTRHKRGKITFSLIGYQTKTIKVNPKQTFIKVILKEEKNVLDKVVIIKRPKKRLKKKENPAYPILKQIWKRKKHNGLKQVKRYEYRKHETNEIGLNRLDTVFLKKLFKQDYPDIINELPYDNEGFHYTIPIYIKERVYHIYGNNLLGKERIDVEAEKSKGFEGQGFAFERMANKFDEVDIYKNTFNLFNKPFVSPVSTTGFDTYDYLLYDSITKGNKKYYNIYFFPRRKGDLAFEGNFLVSAQNFSISKISMRLKKDANVNFIRNLYIEKEYTIINDSLYLPKTDIFEGDFSLIDKRDTKKGITLKKTYQYFDYNFNNTYPEDFYDQKVEQYYPKQFKKDKNYWEKHTTLQNTKKTYQLINNVKNKKSIASVTKWINILTTGYFFISKNLQFGPVFTTIGKNGVEGIRLAPGFRTFKSPDDRFRLRGHLAYGVKSKTWGYEIKAKYLISYKPRIMVGVVLSEDNVQQSRTLLNVSNIMSTENFGSNFIFSRGKNVFISRIRERSLKLDYRIAKNFHVGIIPSHKIIQPADYSVFSMDYLDENGNIKHKVTDIGSDFYITYTPGRDVYGYGVEQAYGKNPFPSFILNYHRGFKALGGDFSYDKLQFRYQQKIILGKIGYTDLTIDLGKTFQTVPLALLNPIPANQILISKPNTFSLLNYYDYVTDSYAVGHFEHHFNGFFLNRIPLIKHLKLKTVAAFRAAYGTISDENKNINLSNIQLAAPSNDVYYEYSIGVENIGYGNLRFLRIDGVWRSKHQSINGLYSPKFAIRLAIRPDF